MIFFDVGKIVVFKRFEFYLYEGLMWKSVEFYIFIRIYFVFFIKGIRNFLR